MSKDFDKSLNFFWLGELFLGGIFMGRNFPRRKFSVWGIFGVEEFSKGEFTVGEGGVFRREVFRGDFSGREISEGEGGSGGLFLQSYPVYFLKIKSTEYFFFPVLLFLYIHFNYSVHTNQCNKYI